MRRQQASPATIAVIFAILGSLALGVAPASARVGHQYSFSFAGAGLNALSAPTGIAIDNSNLPSAGSVYVTDPTNKRVEKFDAAGNFVLMFGKNVDVTTPGDVCPVNPGDVCQPGTSGSGPAQFSNPLYVAVDSSSGPSAGDVYVGDGGQVQKFDSGGHLITSWGGSPAPGQINKATPTPDPNFVSFSTVLGIAVDANGNLAVSAGQPFQFLTKFDQAGNTLAAIKIARPVFSRGLAVDPAGSFYASQGSGYTKLTSIGVEVGQVNSTGTTLGVAVDPSSGDLFVPNQTSINSYHFNGGAEVLTSTSSCSFSGSKETSASCQPTESFGSAGNLTAANGIAVNGTSGAVYVADPTAHDVAVFTRFIRPDFTPALETNLTTTSATVNEKVDPAGGPPITECHYEYGTALGNYALGSGTCSPDPAANPPATNFSTETLVSANLSDLELLVPYHYRFVVTTANGTTFGQDRTVRSVPDLPKVNSTSISTVTPVSAVVKADIDPGEGLTTYRFDYGPTSGYDLHTVEGGPIDPEGSDHAAVADLTELEPGVTYHFRATATNFTGTTFGPDEVFTTPSAPFVDATSVSSVGRTSATVSALVNPGLGLTTYHFEYGRSIAYGFRTAESAPIGPDNVTHAAIGSLAGLTAGTTYHFRIVASNGVGTTFGLDQTFKTVPPEEVRPEEEKSKPCKKGFVKKHGKCVRKPHRHHRKHRRHMDRRHG